MQHRRRPAARRQKQRLFCASIFAPSCANTQPWRIVAITGERLPAVRQALSEGNKWATRAPLIVVMATKPSLDMRLEAGRDYAYFDLGMAALALMLQATREGLYAHPIAGDSRQKWQRQQGFRKISFPSTSLSLESRGRCPSERRPEDARAWPASAQGLGRNRLQRLMEKPWGMEEFGDLLSRQGSRRP